MGENPLEVPLLSDLVTPHPFASQQWLDHHFGIDLLTAWDDGVMTINPPTDAQMRHEHLKEIVRGYYTLVDTTNLMHESGVDSRELAERAMLALVEMVDEQVVYLRSDREPIAGRGAWEKFYRQERNPDGSMSGRHSISVVSADGDTVFVTGEFHKPGMDTPIRFADAWRFGEDKVVRRETYLAVGAAMVEGGS